MKTILHIIDTTGPGGAETVFLQLAKTSESQGYRSIALIRGPGWVQSELERLNLTHYVIDCKGSINFNYLKKLLQLIKSENVDIIQTHLFGSAVYASLAGFISRKPVYCTIHGLVDIGEQERFKAIKLLALRLGCKKVITVTDRLYKTIQSLPIINKNRIQTIYNGIEISHYEKVASSPLHSEFKLSDELLIGSVGNIRTPKNYPLAIDTIHKLHQQGIKAHYAIAGQGNDKQLEPIRALIEQYGLSDYIHIFGFVSDIQQFLSALDIFLMSSSSEGHPLALTQAMINNLAIVSTPSGVEEIVSHEVEALISQNHDAQALADCIKALYLNPDKASTYANNALKKARDSYSLQAMTSQYFTLYKGL